MPRRAREDDSVHRWYAWRLAALVAMAATAAVWTTVGPLTAETPQTSAAKVWPTKRRPDHRAILFRQRHRPASANGVRARRGQRRSDHHHRKPTGRGRGHRR